MKRLIWGFQNQGLMNSGAGESRLERGCGCTLIQDYQAEKQGQAEKKKDDDSDSQ